MAHPIHELFSSADVATDERDIEQCAQAVGKTYPCTNGQIRKVDVVANHRSEEDAPEAATAAKQQCGKRHPLRRPYGRHLAVDKGQRETNSRAHYIDGCNNERLGEMPHPLLQRCHGSL